MRMIMPRLHLIRVARIQVVSTFIGKGSKICRPIAPHCEKLAYEALRGCTALLVLRFVVSKWRYIKYLALPFYLYCLMWN